MTDTNTEQHEFHRIMERLDSEMRTMINPDNESFLRTHAPRIPEVVMRSSWRLQRLSPGKLMEVYGALVFELALCKERLGHYRDPEILNICLILILQRRLDAVTKPASRPRVKKPAGPLRVVAYPSGQAQPRKPKFRRVA